MEITLTISKNNVMASVARKTTYAGGKLQEHPKADDPAALDRIATVDEDEAELNSFWDECRAEVAKTFAAKLVSEGFDTTDTDSYKLTLKLWDGFNTALVPSMEIDLKNYFIYGIIARWYLYTHREDVENYASMAERHLDNVMGNTIQRVFERKMYPY